MKAYTVNNMGKLCSRTVENGLGWITNPVRALEEFKENQELDVKQIVRNMNHNLEILNRIKESITTAKQELDLIARNEHGLVEPELGMKVDQNTKQGHLTNIPMRCGNNIDVDRFYSIISRSIRPEFTHTAMEVT